MKYVALLLLASLQVLLSIILGHKRQSKVSQTFIYFTALLFAWTLANTVLDYSVHAGGLFHSYSQRLLATNIANRAGFLLGALSLILLYRLVLVFPLKAKNTKLSSIMTFGGVLVALSALTPYTSGRYVAALNGGEPIYVGGGLSLLILLYFLAVAALAIRTVIDAFKRSVDPLVKRQTKTLLAALLATGALAVLIIIVLPLIFKGNDSFIFLGYFSPYVFTTALFYSIFRQGFLDFRAIVARSVGYILSLGAIVVVFAAFTFSLVRWLSGDAISIPQAIIFAAFNAVSAIAFNPLKKFFNRITRSLFYQDAYDPQELFDELNKILVDTIDLDRLLTRASELIAGKLKAEYCSFVLREKKMAKDIIIGTREKNVNSGDLSHLRQLTPGLLGEAVVTDYLPGDHSALKQLLDRNKVALLARLGAPNGREEGLGYITLGPKLSGNSYSKQDAKIVDSMANELVIAIQNALQFIEIQQFNVTLQDRVDEATHKLRKVNEKLKALDETKDDFISMASHQLRTPLTSVKGYISMVLEGDAGKLTKMERDMLGQAFFSSQRMVYLIADLLNVSRLKTGKFVIESNQINLATIVKQELEQLKETAASRELTLDYTPPKDFPDTMLDETKTRQVIMNFVDNAIYYTPAGGRINVRLLHTPTTIELRVEDDGIGVAKSDQPHLFTKFFRAGNARKARPDGTGLGLFMAKKVIIAEGGSLIFESEEGKGSTFGFVFSRARTAPPQTAAKASSVEPAKV